MADKIKMELLIMDSMTSGFRKMGDRSSDIIKALKQTENGLRDSYVSATSVAVQSTIDDVLKLGREVTEGIYKLSIQLNNAKVEMANADKKAMGTVALSCGTLYRGDKKVEVDDFDKGAEKLNTALEKSIEKSFSAYRSEKHDKSFFDEVSDKAEEAWNFVANGTKEFITERIEALRRSLEDFKYIAGSIISHPGLFGMCLVESSMDNIFGNGTSNDRDLKELEYKYENEDNYEALTAMKAGETGGDVFGTVAGSTLQGIGTVGTMFGGGVTGLGLMTSPEGAVVAAGGAAITAAGIVTLEKGGQITSTSAGSYGNDFNSVFQYAHIGEFKNNLSNSHNIDRQIVYEYDEIRLGKGTPNLDVNGKQKIYQGRENKNWIGAEEYDVLKRNKDGTIVRMNGKPVETNNRILVLRDSSGNISKMGYVEKHNYRRIKIFPEPWFPDGGK